MSAILQKIKTDADQALKNKDMNLRSFLNTLADAVRKVAQNDNKSYNRESTDSDAVKVLRANVLSCEDNIKLLESHNRAGDADKYKVELAIYQSYLPGEITEADIETTVVEIVGDQEKSIKLMGKVITALKLKYGAALNPATASTIVKRVLGVS